MLMFAAVFASGYSGCHRVVLGPSSPCSSAVTARNRIERLGGVGSFVNARAISSSPAVPDGVVLRAVVDLVAVDGGSDAEVIPVRRVDDVLVLRAADRGLRASRRRSATRSCAACS